MSGPGSEISSPARRWLLFYGVIIAAWGLMILLSFGSGHLHPSGFWLGFAMWLGMSAAMMAPTFAPSLRVFEDLSHSAATGKNGFYLLLLGYLLVWAGFSGLAAALQYWLAGQGWLTGDRLGNALIGGGALITAGVYQFSKAKDACLSKCRAPLVFFMQYWATGPLKMGLRLGMVCVGCCWMLMLLGFVFGVMNLLWMGLATLLMVLEKLPEIGRYITRPLGAILIFSGAIYALI